MKIVLRGIGLTYSSGPPCVVSHKSVSRNSYKKNKLKVAYNNKIRKEFCRAELRNIIHEIKRQPCTDCGLNYPHWVMQFDHLDGSTKIECISVMVGIPVNKETLLAEINKCELVCANCHATRTYLRRTGQYGPCYQ
jgi:hypothetical protein